MQYCDVCLVGSSHLQSEVFGCSFVTESPCADQYLLERQAHFGYVQNRTLNPLHQRADRPTYNQPSELCPSQRTHDRDVTAAIRLFRNDPFRYPIADLETIGQALLLE